MPIKKRRVQGIWGSRWTFWAAAVALVAGLGDFWATPLFIAQQGGSLYLISYLLALCLMAMPVAIAELRIAVRARANPIHAFDHFITYSSASRFWVCVPLIAGVAVLLLLARLSLVGAWLLGYTSQIAAPEMQAASLDTVASVFTALSGSSEELWQNALLFLFLVAAFSALEVGQGLAMLLRVLLPLMLVMLVTLVYYAYQIGDPDAAHAALFEARRDDFGLRQGFSALQQAFYTLCLGSFALMAYGAYFPVRRSIDRQVAALVVLDVLVMLLGGIFILALVADQHLLPGTGPALLFISLPYTFGNIVFGDLVGSAFFLLLSIFVLTSAVALLEPIVAHAVERWGSPRWLAAPLVVSVVAVLMTPIIGEATGDNDWQWLGRNLWEWLDIVTGSILLPLCALLFSLFAGWRIPRAVYGEPVGWRAKIIFWVWYQLLRYIAPPALLLILIMGCYWRFSVG